MTTFPVVTYSAVVPISNELLEDAEGLIPYIERAMHAALHGHHAEGVECCCGRTFATARGCAQHARYQWRKRPPPFPLALHGDNPLA